MSGSFYIDVIIIVLIQSTLLFLYDFFVKKYSKKNDELDDKLKTVRAILESTKHEKILSLDRIKEIELHSNEVFVFSKDMFRDVKNSGQFSDSAHNVGTFYDTVKTNLLKSNINYTYFLKQDSHWKHFLHSFSDSYKEVEQINTRVSFFMINAQKYFFYDEIYLYIDKDGEYQAFEFLPSISNEEEELLFFLELGERQVQRLKDIKDELIQSHKKENLSTLLSSRV